MLEGLGQRIPDLRGQTSVGVSGAVDLHYVPVVPVADVGVVCVRRVPAPPTGGLGAGHDGGLAGRAHGNRCLEPRRARTNRRRQKD